MVLLRTSSGLLFRAGRVALDVGKIKIKGRHGPRNNVRCHHQPVKEGSWKGRARGSRGGKADLGRIPRRVASRVPALWVLVEDAVCGVVGDVR